jgi:hypothetical protein
MNSSLVINNKWCNIDPNIFGLTVQWLTLSALNRSRQVCKSWLNIRTGNLFVRVSIYSANINALIQSYANNVLFLVIYKCCDADLLLLPQLSKLQELNLSDNNNITNEGLKYLSVMNRLQCLDLSKCDVTDDVLARVSVISGLQEINLSYCKKITDEGLKYLSTINGLLSIDLSSCNISDEGLRYLSRLKKLQYLVLPGCINITDLGLKYLSGMDELIYIELSYCKKVSATSIREFSDMNKCKIYVSIF